MLTNSSYVIHSTFLWNDIEQNLNKVIRNKTARKTKTKRVFPIGRGKVHREVSTSCKSSVFLRKN